MARQSMAWPGTARHGAARQGGDGLLAIPELQVLFLRDSNERA